MVLSQTLTQHYMRGFSTGSRSWATTCTSRAVPVREHRTGPTTRVDRSSWTSGTSWPTRRSTADAPGLRACGHTVLRRMGAQLRAGHRQPANSIGRSTRPSRRAARTAHGNLRGTQTSGWYRPTAGERRAVVHPQQHQLPAVRGARRSPYVRATPDVLENYAAKAERMVRGTDHGAVRVRDPRSSGMPRRRRPSQPVPRPGSEVHTPVRTSRSPATRRPRRHVGRDRVAVKRGTDRPDGPAVHGDRPDAACHPDYGADDPQRMTTRGGRSTALGTSRPCDRGLHRPCPPDDSAHRGRLRHGGVTGSVRLARAAPGDWRSPAAVESGDARVSVADSAFTVGGRQFRRARSW